MRERLLAVFETMKTIETKGDSTVFMADCLREIVAIINSIPEEKEGENEQVS